MKSADIRERFLKYFEGKGHKRLPGSSLVPSDPSVLLTLAGMLQFKPIFLGIEKPKQKRATTVQKCIRMNDVAQVGRTSRHHTFFEMLGNFSFGDYFKQDAIIWAWEFLTKELGLTQDKLHIAVFEKDDEAFNIWQNVIRVPKDHIYRLGEDNNFWAAGATGPCGPCSEIYYDLGTARGCGKPGCGPGCDCERFLEVWNLVFIEFNRDENGKLSPLPAKNIDTGMGLERIASVMQDVPTNFDTDLFVPIIEMLREMLKKKKQDINHPGQAVISERVIADHARAATHLIADGVLPSNEGRGYVLRSLIRRAVRHGWLLGLKETFLHKLSRQVISVNGQAYPEIVEQADFISQVIMMEEEHFGRTLEQGMVLIGNMIKKCVSEGKKTIAGKDVFVLHDTFGFPVDLTKEIASESGLNVDEAQFMTEMNAQKTRGRVAGIGMEMKEKVSSLSKYGPTKFEGYTTLATDSRVIYIDKKDKLVILDKTPFYPESGGQAGDVGKLIVKGKEINVLGAFGGIGDVIAHKVDDISILDLKTGVKAEVNGDKRQATASNHTATHLLQATLREIYGKHVKQTGSLVAPDRFRFDFTHFGEISKDDVEKIERRINEKIKEKIKVDVQEVSLEEARKHGAMMLFDEKYGERVRMVTVNGFSTELCGGTHVKNTGDISFFKVISDESVSTGVRRIEAKTCDSARSYLSGLAEELWEKNRDMFATYEGLELKKEYMANKPGTYYQFFRITEDEINMYKGAVRDGTIFLINRMLEDFKKKNVGLQERIKELKKEARKKELAEIKDNIDSYEKKAAVVGSIKIVNIAFRGHDSDFLREVSDIITNKVKKVVSVLFSVTGDKVTYILSLSKDLVSEGYNADAMIKDSAKMISGGGGGRPHLAEAGGHDASRIGDVVARITELIRQKQGS